MPVPSHTEGRQAVLTTPDLDAYFARIRWGGEVRPTLATLAGLLEAHMTSVPFENLDVLLGRPVRLDLGSLQDKLVRGRRGGYCFEHVTLFAAVLEQLGFRPARHTARVTLAGPRAASPRTHMLLTVPVAEGTFVVDPGLGGAAPRVPIPLVDGAQAQAGVERYVIRRDGEHWVLSAEVDHQPVDAWASALRDDNLIDFEVGNHFTSTHSSSPFVNNLMLGALSRETRVTVRNRVARIRHAGGRELVEIADRAQLRALLVEYFGFDLPEILGLRVPAIPEWA
jgi:N-hydroxyarylamine O-acetyltransferase